ncbi:MAG: lysostaphin resistance A-like protein [Acidimicrobiales bacterium]
MADDRRGPPSSAEQPRWPTSAPGQATGWGGARPTEDGADGAGGRWPGRPGALDQAGYGRRRVLPARAAWWAAPGGLAAIVLAGVGASIGQGLTGSSKGPVTELLGEVGLWAALVGTAAFVSRRYGTASFRRDYGLSFRTRDPLWGVLAAGAAIAVAQLVLLGFSGTKFAGSNSQIVTQEKGHELGLVLVALIVAVGAPFFEELFFRGFLRTTLQARFGAHGAVWLQAAVFGLAHVGETAGLGNVSLFVAMFGVGVVLGYTARLTGRLGAGMTAHCLFNLVAVLSVV